jgi:hypothetical protein
MIARRMIARRMIARRMIALQLAHVNHTKPMSIAK